MRKVLRDAVPVLTILGVLTMTVVLLVGRTSADEVLTFEPSPKDLYDLPHSKYFTWGIDTGEDFSAFNATGASLTFKSIRNWNSSSNQLYVHLLDNAPLGVKAFNDGGDGGDAFLGLGILLVEYNDLPSTSQTLTHEFTPEQMVTLNEYLANGDDVGLGFDPDCHFYNCGVELELAFGSTETPEPGTMALVGTGLLGMIGIIRRRRMT